MDNGRSRILSNSIHQQHHPKVEGHCFTRLVARTDSPPMPFSITISPDSRRIQRELCVGFGGRQLAFH